MPPYSRPTGLPPRLRELNDALHSLHERAGLPSTRDVSKTILRNEHLAATASHERVRSAFSDVKLPNWELVQALVTVLCPRAGREPDSEVERFRSLWLSALREFRRDPEPSLPAEKPATATGDHGGSQLPTVGQSSFALNMTTALADQLATALSLVPPRALSVASLVTVEQRPGVYQLFHRDRLVYVGKAESLPTRLGRAARKISGRCNIAMEDVCFNCIEVNEDFSAVAPDKLLLKRNKDADEFRWNYNGFGNHPDPGRIRDEKAVSRESFDYQFPINLEQRVPELGGQLPLGEAVLRLKRALPYIFRHERKLLESPLIVDFGGEAPTVNYVMNLLVQRLGRAWQVTALPGHVILYEENRQYLSALRTYHHGQLQEL